MADPEINFCVVCNKKLTQLESKYGLQLCEVCEMTEGSPKTIWPIPWHEWERNDG